MGTYRDDNIALYFIYIILLFNVLCVELWSITIVFKRVVQINVSLCSVKQ